MEGYLRVIGAPQDCIQAQIEGEKVCRSRNVILLQEDHVKISKRTMVNNISETNYFDVEVVKESTSGERRSTTTLIDDGSGIITTTTSSNAEDEYLIYDARELIDLLAHTQTITISNLNTGECHVTRRTWRRI